MIATVPAEACALGTAIRTLQTEPAMRILAAGLARYEVSGEKNYDFLNERRRILWAAVVHRIVNGEVSCAGFRDGSTTPDLISRYFLRSAVPNFEANTLTLGDVVYHGLWFFLAAPTAPSQESGPSLPLTGSPSQPQAQAAMPRRKGGRRPGAPRADSATDGRRHRGRHDHAQKTPRNEGGKSGYGLRYQPAHRGTGTGTREEDCPKLFKLNF